MPCGPDEVYNRLLRCAECFEKLKLSSMTPDVRQAHRDVNMTADCAQSFNCANTYVAKNLGCRSLFPVGPFFFLSYAKGLYVLDHSSVEQVRLCMRFWAGARCYCANYRIIGDPMAKSYSMTDAFDKCLEWVSYAMKNESDRHKVPRLMKTSVAKMQAGFHSERQTLDVGVSERIRSMSVAEAEIINLGVHWSDTLNALNIPERAKVDLGYLYHGLPAPDCDLAVLFKKAQVDMCNANRVDGVWWSGYMDYVKSYDLCKALTSCKKKVKHKCLDGYTCEDKPWWVACIKGDMTLPPEDELGKAWIYKHFPYDFSISDWYWEAGDVTHILSDIKQYSSTASINSQDRDTGNELLYALKHAPLLSCRYSPDDAVEMVASGSKKYDTLAVMAAKSENTKYGRKVRATFSGDDITREMTSKYDRAAVPLASLYPGVTSRKSERITAALHSRICDAIHRPVWPQATGLYAMMRVGGRMWATEGHGPYTTITFITPLQPEETSHWKRYGGG